MDPFPPPRRGRPSLAERAAASGVGTGGQPAPEADSRQAAGEVARGRRRTAPSATPKHCWVDDPRWPGRRPALLLTWSRAERGWWGQVVLVPDDGRAVTEWVAASALTPA